MGDDETFGEDETFTIDHARCDRGTERALHILDMDTGRQFWVPLSVIDDDSEVYGSAHDCNSGKLIVPGWFAEKEGLDGRLPSKLSQDLPRTGQPVPRGRHVETPSVLRRLPKAPPRSVV